MLGVPGDGVVEGKLVGLVEKVVDAKEYLARKLMAGLNDTGINVLQSEEWHAPGDHGAQSSTP